VVAGRSAEGLLEPMRLGWTGQAPSPSPAVVQMAREKKTPRTKRIPEIRTLKGDEKLSSGFKKILLDASFPRWQDYYLALVDLANDKIGPRLEDDEDIERFSEITRKANLAIVYLEGLTKRLAALTPNVTIVT